MAVGLMATPYLLATIRPTPPLSLTISERVISPSLGEQNLKAGFRSCIIGLCFVFVFLVGYY